MLQHVISYNEGIFIQIEEGRGCYSLHFQHAINSRILDKNGMPELLRFGCILPDESANHNRLTVLYDEYGIDS